MSNYHNYKTNNHWPSVDAHIQDCPVTVERLWLPTQTPNTSVMHNRNQMQFSIAFLTNP